MRQMLTGKIHRATVTEANINYEGSITIDSNLMKAAGILPYEMVHVLDVDNGSRLTTYAIEGDPDSGVVCVNGAAARLVYRGDKVIILAYQFASEEEAKNWSPKLVYVDSKNRIVRKAHEIKSLASASL